MAVDIIDTGRYYSEVGYDEYRRNACRKEIRNLVLKCKVCVKSFFHPGYVNKHRTFKDKEMVRCEDPFEKITPLSEKVEMRKSPILSGIGTVKHTNMDTKIDWLIKMLKEMKDEVTNKEEIKMIIKNIIKEEVEPLKREIEEVKRSIQIIGKTNNEHISYNEATKARRGKSILIVKPRAKQKSEVTKTDSKKENGHQEYTSGNNET